MKRLELSTETWLRGEDIRKRRQGCKSNLYNLRNVLLDRFDRAKVTNHGEKKNINLVLNLKKITTEDFEGVFSSQLEASTVHTVVTLTMTMLQGGRFWAGLTPNQNERCQ